MKDKRRREYVHACAYRLHTRTLSLSLTHTHTFLRPWEVEGEVLFSDFNQINSCCHAFLFDKKTSSFLVDWGGGGGGGDTFCMNFYFTFNAHTYRSASYV